MWVLLVFLIPIFVVAWILLAVVIGQLGSYQQCSGCKECMPDGYFAYDTDTKKYYCRACAKRHGIRPWYYREHMPSN